MNLLRGFLDNDSAFGQLMTRCWIIIACNVLFVLLFFLVGKHPEALRRYDQRIGNGG